MFDASANQHILHSKTYIKQITESSLLDAFMSFFFPHSEVGHAIFDGRERLHLPLEGSRIPASKMRWIIQSLIEDIDEILETVENFPEVRMYGASILIVYEGDQNAFLNGWEKMLEEDRLQKEQASRQANDNQVADDDSENENEEDEDEQLAKLYSIRLIDFAHSFWAEDEVTEQDAGLLLGLTNASNILRSVLATQKEKNV
jgi:inositol-polyphosphate multikinase